MRTLIAVPTVVLAMLAGVGCSYPIPNLVYPAMSPSQPKGSSFCYATGAPAADGDHVNLFTSYNCGNSQGYSAYIGYMNLDDPVNGASIILTSPKTKNISYHAPVATGYHRAITWSKGDLKDFEVNGLQRPNSDGSTGKVSWTQTGTGWSGSMPTFSNWYNLVYVAMNEDVRAYNLDHGGLAWSHTFTGVRSLSNVVYYEDMATGSYVFWVSDSDGKAPMINKFGASASSNGSTLQSAVNPCNVVAAKNEHFQLEKVKFGEDKNGDLSGMFMYGNYEPQAGSKFNRSNFVVCRFSHHSMGYEHSWGFNDAYTVFGVTGGDNATFFNVYNRDTKTYQVIILNQTQGHYERHYINRTVTDKDNNPVIINGGNGLPPRLVMQRSLNGDRITAYDTWWKYVKPAWARTYGCWLTPTVAHNGGQDRFFCLDEHQGRAATSLDYSGEVIWQQIGVVSGFPPVNMANVYAAFQLTFPVVGFSFDPDFQTPAPGPKPASGPSAAIIFLIVIIILFVIVLGGILFRIWTQKGTRRTSSRMQLDKEGYAGLNA